MSGERPWIEGDLVITSQVMADMEAHAIACYPSECCGLGSGPEGEPGLVDGSVREENEADKYHKLDPVTFPRTSRTYFKINELRAARELIATNAVRGARAILTLDDAAVGSGNGGPVLKRLQALLAKV